MEIGNIVIELDRRWELRDFSVLTNEYVHLYSFFYALEAFNEDTKRRLDIADYPWEGGYSVVNAFRRLYGFIEREHRPKINKIQYASPGYIELSGVIAVAKDVSILIATICASAYTINKTYDAILQSYYSRKLSRLKISELEAKQAKDDIRFVNDALLKLKKDFNLSSRQIKALEKVSKGDALVQLKLLLSLYRRAKPVADQQIKKKTKI